MTGRVFYSWQLDLDAREHKELQQRALRRASEAVEREMSIPIQVVDFGNERIGSPAFGDHLVEQIATSCVVVADMTLTGIRPERDGQRRLSPNPNVANEVGIARGLLGAEALIMVVNEAHGNVALMPPDFASYIPCRYNLQQGAPDEQVQTQEDELTAKFAEEIKRAITAAFFEPYSPEVRPAVMKVVGFLLGSESTTDAKTFRDFSMEDLVAATGLREREVEGARDALGELLTRRGGAGQRPLCRATRRLCLQFDILVKPWNPQLDAEKIARLLERDREQGNSSVAELARELGWEAREMNVALEQLVQWAAIGCSKVVVEAESPFAEAQVWGLARIGAIARGSHRRRPRRG
jgi:hypothetical protein